jgi:hypothetical protein
MATYPGTCSLCWKQIAEVQNLKMEVNYGIEQIRFEQAVLVNSEVSCRVLLKSIINLMGITKATLLLQLEIKEQPKHTFTGDVVFLCQFIRALPAPLTID